MKANYGNMITYHDGAANGGGGNDRMRQTNTFKSNINFTAPSESANKIEFENRARRDRQFTNNPLQPGVTR